MNDSLINLFKLQAEICKTLADTNRLMILHELRGGEKSVSELVSALNLPQSNVSRHLALLRQTSIVATRRDGTSIYYRLANPKIAEACDLVREVLKSNLTQTGALARSMGSPVNEIRGVKNG